MGGPRGRPSTASPSNNRARLPSCDRLGMAPYPSHTTVRYISPAARQHAIRETWLYTNVVRTHLVKGGQPAWVLVVVELEASLLFSLLVLVSVLLLLPRFSRCRPCAFPTCRLQSISGVGALSIMGAGFGLID